MSLTSPTLPSTPPLAHLPTDDNPEITSTPPSSPLISSDMEYLPSPMHSAKDDQPELVAAHTFSIPSSTLLPSASHSPSHTPSLAHSAADEVPETASTPPLSSIASAPPSMLSISLPCLPSATEDQLEPEPVCMPSVTSLSPSLPFTPSLAPLFTDDVPELASAPCSSSPISPMDLECLLSPVHSASDDQPEPEPELASTSVPVLATPFDINAHAFGNKQPICDVYPRIPTS